jgi:hypothetical protein
LVARRAMGHSTGSVRSRLGNNRVDFAHAEEIATNALISQSLLSLSVGNPTRMLS